MLTKLSPATLKSQHPSNKYLINATRSGQLKKRSFMSNDLAAFASFFVDGPSKMNLSETNSVSEGKWIEINQNVLFEPPCNYSPRPSLQNKYYCIAQCSW